MPVVNIDLGWLNRLLARDLPPDEVAEALEQLGCDVEEIVEISRHRCPRCRAFVESSMGAPDVRSCPFCGHATDDPFEWMGRLTVVRLDLLAARPDLFDVGGLARALRGFLELVQGLPDYRVEPGTLAIRVSPDLGEPTSYRPFIRGAAMTMPPLDEASLVAIMKLQESLHWGIGRDRKLASIGIYDLDTLAGGIHYRTLDPDAEPFEPLGMPGRLLTGRQILTEHPKGVGYAHLLSGLARFPVLVDSRGQVLSMPPIINSEPTKLKLGTRELFIDVTGIGEAAVVKSLDTLVCSLIELGGRVRSVQIHDPLGTLTSPCLDPRQMDINRAAAEAWLGFSLDAATLTHSLRRMRFDVEPLGPDGERFRIRYPAFRTDVKHMVDLFEDLAIGYGYSKIEPRLVPTMTVGQARPEEVSSALARSVLLGLGFSEVMSLPLNTEEEHFLRFRQAVPERYVRVANPKMKGLTVVRSHLLTGLLQSLYENRRRSLPLRLFEIDNVVELDPEAETGAREERRLALVEMGREAGYASIRAVLDSLLREFGAEGSYFPHEHPSFLAGRSALFRSENGISGLLGEMHPEVILGFGLEQPVTIAELVILDLGLNSGS